MRLPQGAPGETLPLQHFVNHRSRGDPFLSDSEESHLPQPYVHSLEVTRPDFIINGLKAFLLALAGKPESAFAAPDQRQTGHVGHELEHQHSLGSPLKLMGNWMRFSPCCSAGESTVKVNNLYGSKAGSRLATWRSCATAAPAISSTTANANSETTETCRVSLMFAPAGRSELVPSSASPIWFAREAESQEEIHQTGSSTNRRPAVKAWATWAVDHDLGQSRQISRPQRPQGRNSPVRPAARPPRLRLPRASRSR